MHTKTIVLLTLLFLIAPAVSSAWGKHPPNTAKTKRDKNMFIKIRYKQTTEDDTLILYRYSPNALSGEGLEELSAIKAARKQGGWFIFDLRKKKNFAGYILVALMRTAKDRADPLQASKSLIRNLVLGYRYAEPGDQISIIVNPRREGIIVDSRDYIMRFSGHGALKYRLSYEADSAGYLAGDNLHLFNSDYTYNPTNVENLKIKTGLAIINRYKNKLSVTDYYRLVDYVINNGNAKQQETRLLLYHIKKLKTHYDTLTKSKFLARYDSLYSNGIPSLPMSVKLTSINFADAELDRQALRSYLINGTAYKDSLYQIVKKKYKGELRERMITGYFYKYAASVNNYNMLLDDATSFVKSKGYSGDLRRLSEHMTGMLAFNFALPDTSGKIINLSDFKGKVVFIDFWYTGCAGCASFYQNHLAAVEEDFESNPGAVFITVSIDRNKTSWEKSILSGKYTSPKVVNLFTNGKGASGDVIKYYQIHDFPQPMIIGKDRRIVSIGPDLRSSAGIIKTMDKLLKN